MSTTVEPGVAWSSIRESMIASQHPPAHDRIEASRELDLQVVG
jgi:hypothetical protein